MQVLLKQQVLDEAAKAARAAGAPPGDTLSGQAWYTLQATRRAAAACNASRVAPEASGPSCGDHATLACGVMFAVSSRRWCTRRCQSRCLNTDRTMSVHVCRAINQAMGHGTGINSNFKNLQPHRH